MIGTNNRKIVRRLAFKSLKANQTRSLAIVCAIVLTTLLITSMFTLSFSLSKSSEYTQMRTVGTDFHGGFKYLTPSEVATLKKHPSIRQYGISLNVGTISNPAFKDTRIEVHQIDKSYAKHSFVNFIAGGLPSGENEIALNTWELDKLGLKHKLGQRLNLEIEIGKQTISQDFILSGYYEADEHLALAGMAFVSEAFAKKNLAQIDPLISKTDATYINTSDLSVMFNNSINIEKKLNKVLADTGLDAPIGVNWAYSTAYLSDNIMNLIPYAAVVFIIMLSGYLLIYNIFYISVVRDVKFYGLLKTIGTTPRQLKRIISIQAKMLYVIALPFGMAIGYAIGQLITPMANSMSSETVETSYSASPFIFLGAALFSYLTVWIAASKPSRIAARISPVEAVKFAGIRHSGRKITKQSKHGARIYSMAFSNLFRNKKKLLLMLSSLSLSIVLFSIIFTVISSLDVNKYLSSFISGDFVVNNEAMILHEGERGDPLALSEPFCSSLSKIPNVKSVDKVYFNYEFYPLDEAIRSVLQPFVASPDPGLIYTLKNGAIFINLYGLDTGWLDWVKKDILEGTFDKQKFMSGDYAIITESILAEDSNATYYHPGDKITYETLGKSYEVMAVLPYDGLYAATTKSFSSNGYNVFLPSSELNKMLPMGNNPSRILSATIHADPTKLSEVEEAAKALTAPIDELSFKSREDYKQELGGFIRIFQTVGYGLSFVIALIGVLNYINTVLTGVISRRNEFAILESIGMTKKQLKKMLVYEGLYNVLLTVAITSTLGVLITYSISKNITGIMAFTVFHMSWLPFILVIPILLVIAYTVTLSAYKTLNKATIVERLREVE
ncbi:FtsX-like permease family protein [Paenibacillus sp. 19GGS1-52]|uniref:ABC transporter permease n=1 Tax=Paenibacillus sp. 19GGS1-52 TaxID=2758563 RepID=UPI001EFA6A5F|nr:FtsX-like permease family protein [Paenibacillus sp. 19GGS1-52]ULO08314.1 FtsX-like permease family protein [Paenibacillus sp. 19GGS1-52]